VRFTWGDREGRSSLPSTVSAWPGGPRARRDRKDAGLSGRGAFASGIRLEVRLAATCSASASRPPSTLGRNHLRLHPYPRTHRRTSRVSATCSVISTRPSAGHAASAMGATAVRGYRAPAPARHHAHCDEVAAQDPQCASRYRSRQSPPESRKLCGGQLDAAHALDGKVRMTSTRHAPSASFKRVTDDTGRCHPYLCRRAHAQRRAARAQFEIPADFDVSVPGGALGSCARPRHMACVRAGAGALYPRTACGTHRRSA